MKKIALFLPTVSLMALSAFTIGSANNQIAAYATSEEEPLVSETVSEEVSQEDQKPAESQQDSKEKEVVKFVLETFKALEDKIIPIVGGFSVANVVGIVIAIVTALWKSKGDKANSVLIKGQNTVVEALKNEVQTLETANENLTAFCKEMLESFKGTLEAMQPLAGDVKNVLVALEEQNIHIANVEAMKRSVDVSNDLIAKFLSIDPESVKAGIAEEARKLVEGANSDGEK